MRFPVFLAASLVFCSPATAWERLTTQNDSVIEGEINQAEFVLIDASGGEVVVPRAAISRFEATPEGLKARIKDGTEVVGALQGKLEIGDGLIRRRYSGQDIKSVDFDRFIEVTPGKEYLSCPIRVELEVGDLLGEKRGITTSLLRAVSCNNLRIATFALTADGEIKANKNASVDAQFILTVPEGEDQLVDLSAQLLQGDKVVARSGKRLQANAGGNHTAEFVLSFPGHLVDRAGPAPRLRLQLVSQDAKKKVERGGFFWWFTIPIG
jgi:hypothetical protein